jgi:hypothetical protein
MNPMKVSSSINHPFPASFSPTALHQMPWSRRYPCFCERRTVNPRPRRTSWKTTVFWGCGGALRLVQFAKLYTQVTARVLRSSMNYDLTLCDWLLVIATSVVPIFSQLLFSCSYYYSIYYYIYCRRTTTPYIPRRTNYFMYRVPLHSNTWHSTTTTYTTRMC